MARPTAWQRLAPLIDLVTPMAVRAAATLRVADELAQGPRPVTDLARECDCDPEALRRLLHHLVCHGLFVEPSAGTFALNSLAELLRTDDPSGMQVQLDLGAFGGQMDLAFTQVMHTLRTGEPAWEAAHGLPLWQHLQADSTMGASFDAMMASGPEYFEDALGTFDWTRVGHVVDVGGGSGELLATVLEAHPGLRGTLVDLPDTAGRGRGRLRESGVSERTEVVGQSFFDPLPAGGDLYVLAAILHDWPDEDAVRILRRCAEAAGEGGHVLVVESQGSEGGDPAAFAEMDLRMFVLLGGRERTVDGYAELAARAGLRVAKVLSTPLGQMGIECVPAQLGFVQDATGGGGAT